LAVATLLVGSANLPALGLPHDPSGLLGMLIAALLLWLVIRIPTWVARNFRGSGGRGASMLGSVIRVVLVQHALRAVGLRGARRSGGARPGGRTPATQLRSHAGSTHQHNHTNHHLHPPRTPGPGRPGSPSGRPAPSPASSAAGRLTRPVRPYTAREIAAGVDLYTRALKRRGTNPPPPRSK
jgi:hypothetical protein